MGERRASGTGIGKRLSRNDRQKSKHILRDGRGRNSRSKVMKAPRRAGAERDLCIWMYEDKTRRRAIREMIIATQGHSQHQKSHQRVAGLLDKNSISERGRNDGGGDNHRNCYSPDEMQQ
ncbi:hypothetical protein EVAR_28838_1 [Eumeta japonica]|uniref:Uncharacterized protein n=1 Tax=Eumeta variegata TaxID=151549 RepID=A0A4C1WGT2_EUMVA|nr:hypothetical protein EVAR_28838_1 [Eumeta japonica]